MADDVVLNKVASIERCLGRISDEYTGHASDLAKDITRQDAIILNLLRACETSIDLAMHLTRVHRLGIPQTTRESFDLLCAEGLIEASLAARMKKMVGFRTIAVHNYQALSLDVVRAIIEERLEEFRNFASSVLRAERVQVPR